eukprot:2335156-Prymnesium_polylepis.1
MHLALGSYTPSRYNRTIAACASWCVRHRGEAPRHGLWRDGHPFAVCLDRMLPFLMRTKRTNEKVEKLDPPFDGKSSGPPRKPTPTLWQQRPSCRPAGTWEDLRPHPPVELTPTH